MYRKEEVKIMNKQIKSIDIGLNLMDRRYNKDRDDVVKQSLQDGVGIIITGCSEYSNDAALQYIRNHPEYNLKCTVGIHPHNAKDYTEGFKKKYMKYFHNQKEDIVAVGEIGLDFDRMFSEKSTQIKTFQEMINIARALNMPMFLHERNAVDDFYSIMKENRELAEKSVVHCFTGTKDTVMKYLDLGCMIGITGWICDNRRNADLLEAIKVIPLDRLMVETDGPYLLPREVKGRRNVPSNLHYVWEKIASVLEKEAEEVRKIVLENTKMFFKI